MTTGRESGALDRALLWSPELEPADFGGPPRSRLRLACILGERLLDGLAQEAELLLLTEASGEEMLRFGRPDLLLVESTWFTCTGDWYMAQSLGGERRARLEALLALARSLDIPTVFWMTLDRQHLHLYRDFAGRFDRVFCADPRAIDDFAEAGIGALPLGPAIQPRRFNAVRAASQPALRPGIVYDGWGDLYRFPENRAVLGRLRDRPLSVIDSNAMIARLQLKRLPEPELRRSIRGWVHPHLLPEVYKRADACIGFSTSAATPTSAAWRLLEVAACRTPAVHLGELEVEDPRLPFVRAWREPDDFLADVSTLSEGGLVRERAVHPLWREAHLRHCFAERLTTICRELGLAHEWQAYPKVTVVTVTMRAHLLEKCVEQFLAQSYPNKELLVVFNGPVAEIEGVAAKYASLPGIAFTAVPTDRYAGSLLNLGLQQAGGDYFFRIDDDDHYGTDYLLDAMLSLRCCSAEVFGKRASLFHFEGEEGLYLRKGLLPEIACFPARELHLTHDTLISGCSFGGRVDLLRRACYPDDVNLSADTELVARLRSSHPEARCLMLDSLNLVVERSADVGKHTWQESAAHLKGDAQLLEDGIESVML